MFSGMLGRFYFSAFLIFCVVRASSCFTFKYHSNSELEQVLKNFTNTTTNIKARLEQIGSSLNSEYRL